MKRSGQQPGRLPPMPTAPRAVVIRPIMGKLAEIANRVINL
jgi:hypothetical protein